ncbi:PINIT domain-containing protein [Phyllosticta citricarpa]
MAGAQSALQSDMCPYRNGNPDFTTTTTTTTTTAFFALHHTRPARQPSATPPTLPPPLPPPPPPLRSFHVSTPPASFPPSPDSLDAARFLVIPKPRPRPLPPSVARATTTDMASVAPNHPTLATLQGYLRSMVNNDLKEICRAENLKVSGIKVQLQGYITSHFEDLLRKNDINGAWRVIRRAANPGRPLPSPSASTPGRPSVPMYPESPTRHLSQQQRTPATMNVNSRSRQKTYPSRVSFKSSPFYDVLDTVAPSMEIQVYPANRGSAQSQLELSDDLASRLKAEKDLRIMLFSASDPVLAPFTPSDISFPVNIEVKVNGEEVKANFKGLKNKPGSTRPADITDFLRKLPNYTNHIQVTYALTQKARKFTILVNLVRKHSAADLTDRISRGSVLSKERVISEIINKANDEDIVVNSQVVSLRDPVAGVRIQLPCRSTVCSHYECFDATYFLQLQEQAPTWTCPCCSRTISFEALVVDK